MRAEAVQTLERREAEDDDSPVGAAGDQHRVAQLKLAYKGCVTLQEGEAVSVQRQTT